MAAVVSVALFTHKKKKSHGTPESEGTLGKYLAVASENQKCQME